MYCKKSSSKKRRAASEAEIVASKAKLVAKRRKIEADRILDDDDVKIFEFEHKSVQSTSLVSILSDFKDSITTQLQNLRADNDTFKTEFRDLKIEFRGMDIKLTRNTNLNLSGFNMNLSNQQVPFPLWSSDMVKLVFLVNSVSILRNLVFKLFKLALNLSSILLFDALKSERIDNILVN